MHLNRLLLFVALAVVAAVGMMFLPPIPQNDAYHHFAGESTLPNVLSNLPFIAVGIYGLLGWKRMGWEWRAVSIGAVLIGFGSGYYHAAPSNDSLYWDRLPMTIAFTGVFAAIIHDRTRVRVLVPLIVAGIASVEVWRQTGDLRFYGFIQFFPAIGLPYLLLAFPPREMPNKPLWAMSACYVLAKVLEAGDAPVYEWTGHWVAGHAIKHLAGAAALYFPLRSAGNGTGR